MFKINGKTIYNFNLTHPKNGIWFGMFESTDQIVDISLIENDEITSIKYIGAVIKKEQKLASKYKYLFSGYEDSTLSTSTQYPPLPFTSIASAIIGSKNGITKTSYTKFITIAGNTKLDNLKYLCNVHGENLFLNQLGLFQLESELITNELNYDLLNKTNITIDYIDVPLFELSSYPTNIQRLEISERGYRIWM